MAKKKEKGYEEALKELESLMDKVENEDVSIDELSEIVDQSLKLIKSCKTKLRGTEDKIEESFRELED